MTDTPPPPPPRPGPFAGEPPPRPREERDPATSGCLKWGLVGCAALAVVLIVGLLLFLRKAPELMDRLLGVAGQQVEAAAAPDVPPAAKEEFRQEFQRFVDAAKASDLTPDQIRAVQGKIVEALNDGKVTPAEMDGLVDVLKKTTRK